MALDSSMITETSIILMLDGKTHCITRSHLNYEKIKQALIDKDYTNLDSLVDIPKAVQQFGEGHITVEGGEVLYQGEIIHNAMTVRILRMIEEGFDVKPMMRFLDNLMLNPSKRSVDELYGFLEACTLPITDDGHFHAFKKVTRRTNADGTTDLVDTYTGTILNNVGCKPKMLRNRVNDDKDQTCSDGLHFCSQSYLPHYGVGPAAVVLIVKINPANVVSIPSDYKNAKGRCCEYEVIAEYPYENYADAFPSSVDTRWSDYSDDDDLIDDDENDSDDTHAEDQYDEGYWAGQAKAERHNTKGWGYIDRQDGDFGDGYWDGYHSVRIANSPKEDPTLVAKASISDALNNIITPTPVVPATPVEKPRAVRDPATGRFVPKAK